VGRPGKLGNPTRMKAPQDTIRLAVAAVTDYTVFKKYDFSYSCLSGSSSRRILFLLHLKFVVTTFGK